MIVQPQSSQDVDHIIDDTVDEIALAEQAAAAAGISSSTQKSVSFFLPINSRKKNRNILHI